MNRPTQDLRITSVRPLISPAILIDLVVETRQAIIQVIHGLDPRLVVVVGPCSIDGVTGRLVPPRDPSALTAAIEGFLAGRDRWHEMAVRGRVSIVDKFDFRARTRVVEALCMELAEARRA